ncbi:MAG: coenzyme F420-0:L-glutamate ligase [Pseudomonadota bacterium]
MKDLGTAGGVEIVAVPGIPDIRSGDDLAAILIAALETAGLPLRDGDVLCLAHKIASKAEGCIRRLADITPSPKAEELARTLAKDPRKVEVVLEESRTVLRAFRHPGQDQGVMICEHRLGFISANAGVDESNAEEMGTVITLPRDPDATCRTLRDGVRNRFGVKVGVVMTDTFGRPWRLGQVNVAIGLAGLPATRREQGTSDAWGRPLLVTEPAFADEVAAASGLVIRKSGRQPLVLLRGLDWRPAETQARDLIRRAEEDMFR